MTGSAPTPSERGTRSLRRRFLRDFEAGGNLDLFLVSAVSSILILRFVLKLTGYPTVGGGTLHIAHMLWGGLLMLGAMILLMSYLDRPARSLAALVGGVGFGMFLDEVGKFLSRDNDYFYRPAVAVIYVIVIGVYLVARSLHRERIATREEYLVNALREVEEAVLSDLSREERDRGRHYVRRSGAHGSLARGILQILDEARLAPGRTDVREKIRERFYRGYRRVAALPVFRTVMTSLFVGQLAVKLLHVALILALGDVPGYFRKFRIFGPLPAGNTDFGFLDGALLASSLAAAGFVAAGVVLMPRSRLRAFRMFQRSILVSIFLGQVFMFYLEQWGALIGLLVNLLLFLGLRFMIERELSTVYASPNDQRESAVHPSLPVTRA